MRSTSRLPIIAAWGALIALTVLSWLLGEHHQVSSGGVKLVTSIVVIVAFAKALLVSQSFMELRHAAPVLQLAVLAWCVTVCTIVLAFYLTA